MMIEFSYTFAAVIAVLTPILDPAVANLAIVLLIFLKVK